MTIPTHAELRHFAALTLSAMGALGGQVLADYRDDLGYTRLQAELGISIPTGSGVAVTQTEASSGGFNYFPDVANPEFAGKTITAKSNPGGVTGHATTVAALYYGLSSSMAPGVNTIDVFEADNWLHTGFLRRTTIQTPRTENRAVQNHSWVGNFDSGGSGDVEVLRRLDFTIERDDFLAAVGLNNGGSHPALLGNFYNGISVGLTNGGHSSGTSTVDGTGRVKPEIVSPFGATSFATPSVSSAAALLIQKAQSSPLLADAARSVTLKAILLAGATKQPIAGWNRTTTRPLDAHFGAGQLNIFRSYKILAAGNQPASDSANVAARGWNFTQTSAAPGRYFFTIEQGNTASDFSALLTWNRTVATAPAWPLTTSSLANLTLRLYAATDFTVGAQIDSSESPIDNIEHLYIPNLPPGRYALEVTGGQAGVNYGLAWYSQATVTVAASTPVAAEFGPVPGGFTITRAGDTTEALLVNFQLGGSATNGADFSAIPGSVTIPAGASAVQIPVNPLADSLAEGDETVTLTLTTDFAASAGSAAASAAVTIQDRAIDQWRFANFTAPELADPALGGDLADFDGDGLVNRVEYGLGLNPKLADATAAPQARLNASGFLSLTYTKPLNVVDVDYVVEIANTLPFWQSGPGHTVEAQTAITDTTETMHVQSVTAASILPQQFIRLRVERK